MTAHPSPSGGTGPSRSDVAWEQMVRRCRAHSRAGTETYRTADRTVIAADGSYLAGIGCWAVTVAGEDTPRFGPVLEASSSAEMELLALARALEVSVGPATVLTDYAPIADAFAKWQTTRRTPKWLRAGKPYAHLWNRIRSAAGRRDIQVQWVPGHGDRSNPLTMAADQLARATVRHLSRTGSTQVPAFA